MKLIRPILNFRHECKGDYIVYLNSRLLRWINGGFWAVNLFKTNNKWQLRRLPF